MFNERFRKNISKLFTLNIFYFGIIVVRNLINNELLSFFWKIEFVIAGIKPSFFYNIKIIGRPIINKYIGSTIYLGSDVILVSDSRQCFSSSLYSPCKLSTLSSSSVIEIGNNVSLNGTSIVSRSKKISIGARTMIGPNSIIFDSPFHPSMPLTSRNYYPGNEYDTDILIEEDVWIGASVIILPGTIIRSGSIIGAGSIVMSEIPSCCLAAGAPAKVIKSLK